MSHASNQAKQIVLCELCKGSTQDYHEHVTISCLKRGMYDTAFKAYLKARERKVQEKDFYSAARLGIHVGTTLLSACEWILAKRALEITLLDAKDACDHETISQVCKSLGVFHLSTGDTETARRYFARGVRAAREGQIKGEEDTLQVFLDILRRMGVCS